MQPPPQPTEQQKAPLPVRPADRHLQTRETALCRAPAQSSCCPHGDAGQMSFSEGWQIPVVPRPLSCRWAGSPREFPGARLWWRQRSAMHLPVGQRPPLPGEPCPARISFSARCSARGKTPDLPPAVPQGHPPMPFRPAVLPASPFPLPGRLFRARRRRLKTTGLQQREGRGRDDGHPLARQPSFCLFSGSGGPAGGSIGRRGHGTP